MLITAFNCDRREAPWRLGQSCGAFPAQALGKRCLRRGGGGGRIARALVSSLDLKRSGGEGEKKKKSKQINKSSSACSRLAPGVAAAAAAGAPGTAAAPVAGGEGRSAARRGPLRKGPAPAVTAAVRSRSPSSGSEGPEGAKIEIFYTYTVAFFFF